MTIDRSTIEESYEKHATELLQFLMKLLKDESSARDALQNVFMTLLENRSHLEPIHLRAWMFKVATNEARAVFRRRSTSDRAKTKLDSPKQNDLDPAEYAIGREQVEMAQRAVGQLPTTQQTVLKKRLVDGMTFAEISNELDVPLGTVLTRMRTALKSLRNKLAET